MDNIFYCIAFIFVIANMYSYSMVDKTIADNLTTGRDFMIKLLGAQMGGLTFMINEATSEAIKEIKKGKNKLENFFAVVYPIWMIIGIIWYDRFLFIVLFLIPLLQFTVILFKQYFMQKFIIIILTTAEIVFTLYILYQHFYIIN